LSVKCVLWFSPQLWNISQSMKNSASYCHNVKSFHLSTHYFCQILIKFVYSRQIFKRNPHISNVIKIRQVRAELFHADGQTAGRTNKHDEANSRFSQFFERA
jgi:hypothetical protein